MGGGLPLRACPRVGIGPPADPHAHPPAATVASAISGSRLVEIEDGMVPLPDQMPHAFAAVVDQFLSALPPAARPLAAVALPEGPHEKPVPPDRRGANNARSRPEMF